MGSLISSWKDLCRGGPQGGRSWRDLLFGLEDSGLENGALVHSGSALHACPVQYAAEYRLIPALWASPQVASGGIVCDAGKRRTRHECEDGSKGMVEYECMAVSKLLLSVERAGRGSKWCCTSLVTLPLELKLELN